MKGRFSARPFSGLGALLLVLACLVTLGAEEMLLPAPVSGTRATAHRVKPDPKREAHREGGHLHRDMHILHDYGRLAPGAGDDQSESPSPGTTGLGDLLAAAFGVGTALAARRRPRAAMAALGLLLGVSALETGIHSVHHLADPEKAAACAGAWASQHVDGAGADCPVVGPPAPVIELPPASRVGGLRALVSLGVPEARAPPRFVSA